MPTPRRTNEDGEVMHLFSPKTIGRAGNIRKVSKRYENKCNKMYVEVLMAVEILDQISLFH